MAASLFLLVVWVAGCVPAGHVLLPPVTPAPGLGVIIGQVKDAGQYWRNEQLYLYAAPYYAGQDGKGFFMLEVDRHPHIRLEADGSFVLKGVPPGQYVLVVGPTAQEGRLAMDARQEILLITVESDKVLDVGELRLHP
ncbi:MAG: hypothetical protein WHV66_11225 [Anaerolineales bacterium]